MNPQSSLVGMPKSSLLRIPLEVLVYIASYLTTSEYGALRLACRRIENDLFDSFAKEFFIKRQFMISEFSLQALVDISMSRLGPYLKYLIISLERPTPRYSDPNLHPGSFPTIRDALNYHIFYEECLNHQALITTGQDLELLIQAFHNLPALETVSLRDFSRDGRYRDGRDGLWHAYGAPTFLKQTGRKFVQPDFFHPIGDIVAVDSTPFICHTFWIMLQALGKTKEMHSSPRFEVILRQSHLPDIAFKIPRYLEPTILPVIENLKALFLDVGRHTYHSLVITDEGDCQSNAAFLLGTFLSKTKSLEHLRLNFRGGRAQETQDILQWLAHVPKSDGALQFPVTANYVADADSVQRLFPKLPQTPEFPHLQQLDLGMFTIELPLLVDIFKRYKASLRKFSLHKVSFSSPPDTDTTGPVNLWPRFFRQITEHGFTLTAVHLSFLTQVYGIAKFPVEFRDPGQSPTAGIRSTKGWTGTDWERNSHDFIKSMFIDWHGEDELWLDYTSESTEDLD
ncbi:hypothetical protein K449DRAFT_432867 [Hypoxylon sp. EC38]|nr:hypothetical protein K449DRAFT_432867 [Hypoxylon sp. EC38]